MAVFWVGGVLEERDLITQVHNLSNAFTSVFNDKLSDQLATKSDILLVKNDIIQMENRVIKWMFGLILASIAINLSVIGFFTTL